MVPPATGLEEPSDGESFCTFAVNGKCVKMGARAVAEMVLDVTLIGVGEMVVNGVSSAF